MGRGRPRINPPRKRTIGADFFGLVEGPGLPDAETLQRATALIKERLATWGKTGRKMNLSKIARLVQHNLSLLDQGKPIPHSWLRRSHMGDGALMEILEPQLVHPDPENADYRAALNEQKTHQRDLTRAAELADEIWGWTHPRGSS